MNLSRLDRPTLAGVVAGPVAAAAAGSAATATSVNSWFKRLRQPSWAPPDSLFGPVWTTLYAMMGVADGMIATSDHPDAPAARSMNRVQLALNAGWSIVFFGLRKPGLALLEIGALNAAILQTIRRFHAINPRAARLLLPYLAWTSFATCLNASIWWKNRHRDV